MTLFHVNLIKFMLIPVTILAFFKVMVSVEGPLVFLAPLIPLGAVLIWIFTLNNLARNARLKYIENYELPSIVVKKFMMENSNLSMNDVNNVTLALKQFFMAYALCKDGGSKLKDGLMMPSRIADELWHNFVLDSANYEKFCKKAYGEMFHHKPGLDTGGNKNLKQVKNFSPSLMNTYMKIEQLKEHGKCYGLNGVPILFGIDAMMKINGGFYYDLEVMRNIEAAWKSSTASNVDSGSTGACGGIVATDSMGSCGSSGSSSSDGGGCGGGCGGD